MKASAFMNQGKRSSQGMHIKIADVTLGAIQRFRACKTPELHDMMNF